MFIVHFILILFYKYNSLVALLLAWIPSQAGQGDFATFTPLGTGPSCLFIGVTFDIFLQMSYMYKLFNLFLEMQVVFCVVTLDFMELALTIRLQSYVTHLRCWWLVNIVHVKDFTPFLFSTSVQTS